MKIGKYIEDSLFFETFSSEEEKDGLQKVFVDYSFYFEDEDLVYLSKNSTNGYAVFDDHLGEYQKIDKPNLFWENLNLSMNDFNFTREDGDKIYNNFVSNLYSALNLENNND